MPHEVLGEELAADPTATDELQAALTSHCLPQKYVEHPAVQSLAPGELLHLFTLYLDAVQYTRKYTVLGVSA